MDVRDVLVDVCTALEPVLSVFSSIRNDSVGLYGEGVANVVLYLVYFVGAVIGVVFMWWGVRKVAQMVMSAFRSGRISL